MKLRAMATAKVIMGRTEEGRIDVMSEQNIEWTAENFAAPAGVDRLRLVGIAAAVLGLIGCGIGWSQHATHFFQSYLVAFLFWISLSLGALGLIMLNHMTAGAWGLVLRRVNEASASTLGLMALLWIPIYLGMEDIFSWVGPEAAHDEIIQGKAWFLNETGFLIRAVVYFALLLGMWFLLRRYSLAQDKDPKPEQVAGMRRISAPGLLVFALLLTPLSTDWLMSLDPHWYSSIYGAYFIISCAVGAMAFMILMATLLTADGGPMSKVITKYRFHDWGKLQLAFVLVWAYFTVSQLIIIWQGNLPEEILWYKHRSHGDWLTLGMAVAFLHFALPFILLLSRPLKQNRGTLAPVAAMLLVMHWLDYYWQAGPTFHEHFTLHWLDGATMLAIGGLWLTVFTTVLRRHPVLPYRDPYLPEALRAH